MKKNVFLLLLTTIVATTASGCGTVISVRSASSVNTEAFSVVIDNQTAETASLIIDGSETRGIPASQVTKMSMRRDARLFIVKFGDGKSFSQQINTNYGDMVIITISSDSRRNRSVRFDKSSDNRRYDYYDDPYRYRYRYYRPYYR